MCDFRRAPTSQHSIPLLTAQYQMKNRPQKDTFLARSVSNFQGCPEAARRGEQRGTEAARRDFGRLASPRCWPCIAVQNFLSALRALIDIFILFGPRLLLLLPLMRQSENFFSALRALLNLLHLVWPEVACFTRRNVRLESYDPKSGAFPFAQWSFRLGADGPGMRLHHRRLLNKYLARGAMCEALNPVRYSGAGSDSNKHVRDS